MKLRGANCTRGQGSERKSAGKQTPVVWTCGTKGTGLLWKSSRTNRNSRKKKARETNAYVEVENKKRYEGPWLEPGYDARQRSLETKDVHGGPHDKWDNAFDIR